MDARLKVDAQQKDNQSSFKWAQHINHYTLYLQLYLKSTFAVSWIWS